MGGRYYVEVADWLRAVGLVVVESDGWQTRARSSGGFAAPPLGVQWHHTASSTSPENDISWQTEGCDDAPVGNMTIMRDGSVWLVAAGAANTAGKGGPLELSRGTVPKDSGNSTTWAIEVANNGVGERWPVEQIDAYFTASNELNRRFSNSPRDVFSHALGEGDGWTDRKIDPATADAVEGPWRPRAVTSSGTWSLADIRDECERRASSSPDPDPEPPEEDDMRALLIQAADGPQAGALAVAPPDLSRMFYLSTGDDYQRLLETGQYDPVVLSGASFGRIPGAEQVDVIEGAP